MSIIRLLKFCLLKAVFWYMNLIQVSNSRLVVHGNKFQIKACLLKENRGYAFLASNKKVPGHGMLVCLQMVQLKP